MYILSFGSPKGSSLDILYYWKYEHTYRQDIEFDNEVLEYVLSCDGVQVRRYPSAVHSQDFLTHE